MRKKVKKLSSKMQNEFKYGIIAASQSVEDEKRGELTILHLCAYNKKPTKIEYEALKEELNTDPEFGLVGRMGENVFLMEATPEMIKVFLNGGTIDDTNEQ